MPNKDHVYSLITDLRQLSIWQQVLVDELHHLYINENITYVGWATEVVQPNY